MGETHPEDSAPKEPTDAEVDERMKVEFDEPPVALNTSLSTYVLVENLPQVGEDRISRLEGVLTKIFAPCGPLGILFFYLVFHYIIIIIIIFNILNPFSIFF